MTDLHIPARVFGIIQRLYLPLGVKLSAETRLFMDLQLTDQKLLELRDECEAEFDVTITDEWLAGLATLAGLIETIQRLKQPS